MTPLPLHRVPPQRQFPFRLSDGPLKGKVIMVDRLAPRITVSVVGLRPYETRTYAYQPLGWNQRAGVWESRCEGEIVTQNVTHQIPVRIQ